jgi:hypothetical protein
MQKRPTATLSAHRNTRDQLAMSRWTTLLVAVSLGCLMALPATAQWKWRDKTGQTQYSDLPPPSEVPEHDILQRPDPPQPAAAATAAATPASGAPVLAPKTTEPKLEAEVEAKRRKAEQEEAARRKTEAERVARTKADNCVRAKQQIRTLDSGIRIARINQKGEREVLDDAGRAAEVRRTQQIVASDCK